MWVIDWECGSLIGNVGHRLRIIHARRRWGKKTNDVVISCILMQTFDIVKMMHRPGVNRLDGIFFGKVCTIGTKMGMVQHQYILQRARRSPDTKRFTCTQTMQKN